MFNLFKSKPKPDFHNVDTPKFCGSCRSPLRLDETLVYNVYSGAERDSIRILTCPRRSVAYSNHSRYQFMSGHGEHYDIWLPLDFH